MIKLFRNLTRRQAGIRKNFLNQGKITSYLKYTIGEIVLVFIGILTVNLPSWEGIKGWATT